MQQRLQIALQGEIIAFRNLVMPALDARRRDGEAEPHLLVVGLQVGNGLLHTLARTEGVDVAQLEDPDVVHLPVQVVGDHLQRIEQQRLPHHVQVGTERVDNLHQRISREGLQTLIIIRLGQRVVHGLHEAPAGKEVRHGGADHFGIGMLGRRDGHLHIGRKLDVVVAVDAQHLFHHVALARDVHAVSRHLDQCTGRRGFHKAEVHAFQNLADGFAADGLADQRLHPGVIQLHADRLESLRAELVPAHDLRTAEVADQQGCALGCRHRGGRVDAALVAERSVCLETVVLGGLADGNRVEVCRLQEEFGGGLRRTGILAAEYACDAHRLLGVANHQFFATERALHAVQSAELRAGIGFAHHHLASGNLGSIEGVQRVAHFKEHEVGDIHHVVDGALAHGLQALLQPVRRRTHLHTTQRDADIARSQFGRKHLERNRTCSALCSMEIGQVRQCPAARNAVRAAVCVEVARATDVRSAVHAVRREADLIDRIALELKLFAGRRTGNSSGRKHHDALVVGTDAEFVLGTDHTVALHAADLGFLDFERGTVGRGQVRADGRHQHLLAGSHVGRAANHLQQLRLADVEFRNVQVVGIGMLYALHHFGDHDAGKSAGNLLHLFHVFHFQARVGEDGSHLRRRQVKFQVIFQPIV